MTLTSTSYDEATSVDELVGPHTIDAMVEHLLNLEKAREFAKESLRESDERLENWRRVIDHAASKLRSLLPSDAKAAPTESTRSFS